MMKSVAFLSLSLAALVGCGGGESKKPPVVVVDAPPPPPPVDAPPAVTCTMAATVTGPAQAVLQYSADANGDTAGTPEAWVMGGLVNMDALSDALQLELYEGFTQAEYTAPVTIQLTGDETNYATCGACVRGYGDIAADGMSYADDYFATAGTVTITTLSPTMMAGSISGLRLTHVMIDGMTFQSTPVNDGCDTTVGDFNFTAQVSMMKTASGTRARAFKLQLAK